MKCSDCKNFDRKASSDLRTRKDYVVYWCKYYEAYLYADIVFQDDSAEKDCPGFERKT